MTVRGTKIHKAIVSRLWQVDFTSIGWVRALGVRLARILYLFVAEVSEEQLAIRAMSLVYTTLLTIVPLLAVSFSVLKAFGVHTQLLIMLYYFLEPLGPQGVDLSMKIIEFVENVKVGVLGSIGLATLIYTVMSQIQKFESALNYIWNVKTTRGFTKRFNNYLSMLLVAPVLVFSAAGAVTTAANLGFVKKLARIEPFGTAIYFAGRVMPYLLVCAAFTFIYYVLPNTKVRSRAALTGGLFAGVLWVLLGQSFTWLIASPAKYSLIYSGFAVVLVSLIWLYWNFFILLIGARISFYTQNPYSIAIEDREPHLSGRSREKLALLIMFMIAHNFTHNKPPRKLDSFSASLNMPADIVQDMLVVLENAALLISSHDDPPAYFPARDIESITLKEILDAARLHGSDPFSFLRKAVPSSEIETIMSKVDGACADALKEQTLKGLVLSEEKKIQTAP